MILLMLFKKKKMKAKKKKEFTESADFSDVELWGNGNYGLTYKARWTKENNDVEDVVIKVFFFK